MIVSLLIFSVLNLITVYLHNQSPDPLYIFASALFTICMTIIALSIRVINKPKEDLEEQIEECRLKAADVRREIGRLSSIIKLEKETANKYKKLNESLMADKSRDRGVSNEKSDTYILNNKPFKK